MKVYNKKEFENTRLHVEKSLSKLVHLFVYGLFLLLTIAIFSLRYIPKNYIVTVKGTVKMKNTVHLSSIENGKIKEIKKDDVILELETVESTQEKIEWENQLKKIKN